MVYRRNFLDAFWEKVEVGGPDDCWEWTAARYHDDYGALGIRNQGRSTTMRAHAMALVLATSEDAGGRFALHHCDNPPCCNPAHLYWGDQKQNVADADARGRSRRPILRGQEHGAAKLTEDDVRAIRAAYENARGRGNWKGAPGVSQEELAARYGISQYAISRIVRRKSWSHLE